MSARTDDKILEWLEDGLITPPVDVQVGGVDIQVDDTDKMAVSVYGKDSAAGDIALNASAAGDLEVDLVKIKGVAPQLDDTDKIAVSLYGKASAAGDKEILVDSDGHTQADILSITAGETHVGQVGGEAARIAVTPTVTAGAYSANDAVGGVLTFANAARVSGGSGLIKSILIVDDAGQDAELELWLFDQSFTSPGDNAAWGATEAELHNLVGIIQSTDGDWMAAGTPSVCRIEVSQSYVLQATSMFGQLVTRGTPTFAATDDVTVIIELIQD